jgi:hypothetical protein
MISQRICGLLETCLVTFESTYQLLSLFSSYFIVKILSSIFRFFMAIIKSYFRTIAFITLLIFNYRVDLLVGTIFQYHFIRNMAIFCPMSIPSTLVAVFEWFSLR